MMSGRYVWQYVGADVPEKNSHVVRGVGLEDYLAGKPFWWPIVLTQLSYHLLLFALVCFQVTHSHLHAARDCGENHMGFAGWVLASVQGVATAYHAALDIQSHHAHKQSP